MEGEIREGRIGALESDLRKARSDHRRAIFGRRGQTSEGDLWKARSERQRAIFGRRGRSVGGRVGESEDTEL